MPGFQVAGLGGPPNPFVGIDSTVVVAVDGGPGRGRPIFVGAEIAIAIGVKAAPIIVPIVGVVVGRAVEAAAAVAGFEFALAHPPVVIQVPVAVAPGVEGVPFVAADVAVIVDVDVTVVATNAAGGSDRRWRGNVGAGAERRASR